MATTASSSTSASSGFSSGDASSVNGASGSIDSRRAAQLAERALALAERNDLPAAVLACRQSIALAPQSSQGYSTLGILLERAGDSAGAIAAYEKVLQLAPDSLLERESLGRLRVSAVARRTTRDLFVFDDNELFGDERPEKLPSAAAAAVNGAGNGAPQASGIPANKKNAAPSVADVLKKPALEPVAPAASKAPANATPSTQAAIAADAIAASTVPAAKMQTSAASKPAIPFPSTMPTPSGNAGKARLPQAAPANLDWSTQNPTLVQKLKRQPSLYFRGASLALTSVLSLGFLLWAHNYASSRSLTQVSPGMTSQNGTPTAMNPARDSLNQNPYTAAPGVGNAGSSPANPSGSAPVETVAATTPAANTGAGTPNPRSTTARPAAPPTRPAGGVSTNPSTPAAVGNTPATPSSGNSGNYPAMPTPRLGTSASPDDTVRIAPSTSGAASDGGASSGGAPLNPGGAAGRGYVRVSPGGATRPAARPENAADGDERAAGSSARSGDSDAAISRMTRSIESGGGDTAFRYQQRAQLYLQSGDNNSAINDYQSAIAAYNDMIARGERVSFAQSGIRASQRGIQIAQARR